MIWSENTFASVKVVHVYFTRVCACVCTLATRTEEASGRRRSSGVTVVNGILLVFGGVWCSERSVLQRSVNMRQTGDLHLSVSLSLRLPLSVSLSQPICSWEILFPLMSPFPSVKTSPLTFVWNTKISSYILLFLWWLYGRHCFRIHPVVVLFVLLIYVFLRLFVFTLMLISVPVSAMLSQKYRPNEREVKQAAIIDDIHVLMICWPTFLCIDIFLTLFTEFYVFVAFDNQGSSTWVWAGVTHLTFNISQQHMYRA